MNTSATSSTALITGASSGIGAAYARQLAQRGHALILQGRRQERLTQLQNELQDTYNVPVQVVIAELTNLDDIARMESVIRDCDNLTFLVNNAGFGLDQPFHLSPTEDLLAMVRVHAEVTVRLTRAALDGMLARDHGTIVNVASVAAFLMTPSGGLYCATKALITSLTESLHLELADTNVNIQALCPGFTLTEFHVKLGYDQTAPEFKNFMSPDYVVKTALKDLAKGKVLSIPRLNYKLITVLARLLPRPLLYRLVLKHHRRSPLKR